MIASDEFDRQILVRPLTVNKKIKPMDHKLLELLWDFVSQLPYDPYLYLTKCTFNHRKIEGNENEALGQLNEKANDHKNKWDYTKGHPKFLPAYTPYDLPCFIARPHRPLHYNPPNQNS